MSSRLQFIIAWVAVLPGLALIGSGLILDDTHQWRLQLLTGLWLLSLAPRAMLKSSRQPDRRDSMRMVRHGLIQLALVLSLGFGAVALQLTRYQMSQADVIHQRAAAVLRPSPTPQPPTPIPTSLADRATLGSAYAWPVEIELDERGTIFDRDGNALTTIRDGQRIYTNPDTGHIVGFHSRLYGESGIEASYNDYLSGERLIPVSDILESRLLSTTVEVPTADVYLTLDSRLQQAAQAALGERAGAVVLLEPATGAILALATYPRFDPNLLVLPEQASEADVAAVRAAWDALNNQENSPLLNRATQGRYPPGSILKTLTAAAALDSGAMEFPESRITCPNRLETEVGAPPVRNAVEGLSGLTGNPTDLRRAYAWSCNTAFAQIGLLLGPERFGDYAQRFGLGYAEDPAEPALQDIAADAGTIANNADFLQRTVALADTAFGQGQILITPLDMAQMVAVIANDGKLMRPYLVQEVRSNNEVLYRAQPELLRQAISATSAGRMRSIMATSVEIGYAAPVALPGIKIGGKTGTAEVPGGVPHSWFVAIAPLDQSRFAIAVVVERGGEGSATALPVARQILATAFEQ
jgi:peptidoglycan glycosyltransferase